MIPEETAAFRKDVSYNRFYLKFIIYGLFATCILVYFIIEAVIPDKKEALIGLSSMEVVEQFYDAVNLFDFDMARDCVNTQNVNMIGNRIFFTVFQEFIRHHTEFFHGIGFEPMQDVINMISPEEWISNGKPELKPRSRVFGVLIHKMTELSENRIRVEYDFYDTNYLDESRIQVPDAITFTDICELKQENGAWIIDRIDQGA